MIYVTDTHPLVWLLTDRARLSPTARSAFEDAGAQIIIPTIVLTEIRFLYARNRITVDLSAALALVASAGNCLIYPLDKEVVGSLPTTLDIHDAIIVGTALVHRDVLSQPVSLITRDAAITASGLVPVLW